MPKQTVIINVTSVPAYEAGAELCSYVAYPDPAQAVERGRYQVALSRWAITERMKIDRGWALGTQIKPSIFAQSEPFFWRCYSDGTSLLANRAVCATAMVSPFLTRKAQRIDEGLPPTVENICTMWIADTLGYAPGSFKTIEANIWAPTKPIAHVAATLGLWHIGFNRPKHRGIKTTICSIRSGFLRGCFSGCYFMSIYYGVSLSSRKIFDLEC
jgi:hypothetical protein